MKPRSLLLLLGVVITFTSCMTLAVKALNLDNKNATVVTFGNNDKVVAFVPMKHIAPKEFYNGVKRIVDSLKAEGYIAYMESVKLTDSLSQEEKHLLDLKLRKMTGVKISKKGYLDTINNTLMGRRFKNKMKLINQPPYRMLGCDTIKDKIVDVPVNRIVQAYEEKYGALILNDCDYVLKLDKKYDCGREPSHQVDNIILNYRDKHLANAIVQDTNKKIIVIYGALHQSGLLRELRSTDPNWNYTK